MNIKHYISYLGDKAFKKIGFKVTDVTLTKLKGGWLAVTVNWDSNDGEHYKIKYGVNGGASYGYSDKAIVIDFPQLKYRFRTKTNSFTTTSQINIGIQTINGHALNYEPKFFENLKYGVTVYFAPKNWGKINKEIYNNLTPDEQDQPS